MSGEASLKRPANNDRKIKATTIAEIIATNVPEVRSQAKNVAMVTTMRRAVRITRKIANKFKILLKLSATTLFLHPSVEVESMLGIT